MSEQQIIKFNKGVASDLAPSAMQPGMWAFPAENIRIINLDGKGFVITSMESNLWEVSLRGEYNTYSENVVCVGAEAYKGVIYLAMYDPDTGNSSIATYPSPLAITNIYRDDNQVGSPLIVTIDPTKEGFKKTVNPLVNVKRERGDVIPFMSKKMGLTPEKMVRFLFKESYDQTVDLYLCDDINPVRVINTGISIEGKYMDRHYYVWTDIDEKIQEGFLNILPSNSQPPEPEFKGLGAFGKLKPGMYYLFFRFVTKDFARTQFFRPLGPVAILAGKTPTLTCGSAEYDINGEQYMTEKSIQFTLGENSEYSYFEVAVVRYSENKNGSLFRDVYIVNQLFPFGGTATIYGDEDQATFSSSQIVYSSDIEIVSSAFTEIDSRLILGNVQKMLPDQKPLIDFAKEIQASYQAKDFGTDTQELKTGYRNKFRYQAAEDVMEEVDYFPREIYPFGVMYLLKDNTLSEVYPCTGMMENGVGASNVKGLYMFPGMPKLNYSLKAKMIMPSVIPSELKDNVLGFYIVRGKRIENLRANGILFPTMRGTIYSGAAQLQTGTPFVPMDKVKGGHYVSTFYKYFGESIQPDEGYCVPLYGKVFDYTKDPTSKKQHAGIVASGFPMGYYDRRVSDDKYYLYMDKPREGHAHSASQNNYVCQGDYNFPGIYEGINYGMFHKHKFGLYSWDYILSDDLLGEDETFSLELVSCYKDSQYEKHRSTPQYEYVSMNDDVPFTEAPEGFFTEVIANNINNGVSRGLNKFASFFKDAQTKAGTETEGFIEVSPWDTYNGNLGYIGGKPLTLATDFFTRSYQSPRYIGIIDIYSNYDQVDLLNHLCPTQRINDFKYTNVTLRSSRPDVSFYNSQVAAYTVKSNQYFIVSKFIRLDESFPETIVCSKGDCFTGPGWMRQAGWFDQDKNTGEVPNHIASCPGCDAESQNYYEWGKVIGFRSRSTISPMHRNPIRTKSYGDEGQEIITEYSFYPRIIGSNITIDDWVTGVNDSAQYESFRINPGYMKTLPEVPALGYDSQLPTKSYRFPTRLRFTDKAIRGSFRDGWRIMGVTNYIDLDPKDGQITSLHNVLGNLVAIQEKAIRIVPYGAKELNMNNDTAKIVLGQSDYYLDPHTKPIADFGCQHRFGTVNAGGGLFGFDFERAIAWGFSGEAKDLGKGSLNETRINEVVGLYKLKLDTRLMPDQPILGNGIVAAYDQAMSEVYFSMMYLKISGAATDDGVPTAKTEELRHAFVFNAKTGMMIGETSAVSPVMISNDKNFYLVQPDFKANDVYYNGLPIVVKPALYKADIAGTYLSFFGEQNTMKVSFIINGLTSEKDITTFEKIYESLILLSNHVSPKKIIYQTEYQTISKLFVIDGDRFWEYPEYTENKWIISCPVSNQTESDAYSNFSELRGRWLKITIEYEGNSPLVIDEAVSLFTPLNF